MLKHLWIIFILLIPIQYSSADTLVLSVIEQNDDAEEAVTGPNAGNVQRSSSDLEIGNENGIEQWVGLRFQDVMIPAGSVINSATIQFTALETDVGNLIVPIFGERSLDPASFRDVTPLTTRTLTTQTVPWDIQPWFPGERNDRTTTPDVASIVQEIVDQPGWTAGNSIVFIIQNDPLDTSERIAASFDLDPLQAASVTIDFTPPVPVESVNVVRGIVSSGSVTDVQASDNVDMTVQRNSVQTAGIIELHVEGTSGIVAPTVFEFSHESSAFFRSTVVQSISFFDFVNGAFVEIDSRNARRFSDSIVVASGTGDLSRFVEGGTGRIQARILYTSVNRRQAFSAGIDHIFFNIK